MDTLKIVSFNNQILSCFFSFFTISLFFLLHFTFSFTLHSDNRLITVREQPKSHDFVKYQPQDALDFLKYVYIWSIAVFFSLSLFTFTCWCSVVPHSRKLIARSNTRDCWRAIQTITNRAKKVTLCSKMILTAAHAQWTSWVYHLRQWRTVDNYNSKRWGIKETFVTGTYTCFID